MELITNAQGSVRQLPIPNGPTVTVICGGEDGGPDVGLARVHVPAGGGMGAHRHNGSDVVLTPIVGAVLITKGEDSIEVRVGDSALVRKDEEVSLTNPASEPAEIIVAAGPADFIASIRAWPEPKTR